MKALLFSSLALCCVLSLPAQEKNQACYKDTSLVDHVYSRIDTSYSIRTQFRKGDWELFYDFALTKKMAEYHFDNDGNKIGENIEWYENGQTKSDFDYSNSWFKAFPYGKIYYPNGAVRLERAPVNDSLIETSYFEDGKISRTRKWTKTGLLCIEQQWCENGQMIVSYNPTSPVPLPVKKYYCSGKIKSEYNWYVYGYTGSFMEYHENGQVSLKGQFQEIPEGSTVFMARKTGDWIYYDPKGQVTKTEHWSAGKLVK